MAYGLGFFSIIHLSPSRYPSSNSLAVILFRLSDSCVLHFFHNSNKNMFGYFPEEVILEIFFKLPIISLLQCTSVCKFWYSLIKNSTFISTHLNRTIRSAKGDPLFLLRLCSDDKDRFSLHFNDQDFTSYMQLPSPPFTSFDRYIRVLGSCNGLVCLTDGYLCYCTGEPKFILWNPSIRRFLTLPAPNFTYKTHGGFSTFLSFGYDSRSGDFKLVRMLKFLKRSPQVEVFSLNTGSWKSVAAIATEWEVLGFRSQAFVNGRAHWLAYRTDKDVHALRNAVLGFDVGDEAFHEIMLPERLAGAHMANLFVMAYGESSIAVVMKDWNDQPKCHVWVMRDYGVVESWTNLFTVVNEGNLCPRILGFRNNGEMLSTINGEIVSVNLESKRMKHLGIQDNAAHQTAHESTPCSFIETFVENLVLLDRGMVGYMVNIADDVNADSDEAFD